MSVCLHVRVCTTCVSGTPGGQKKVYDLLELELWIAVSSLEVLGIDISCAVSPAPMIDHR